MPAPSVPELRRTLNRQVLKAHAAKVIAVFQSWDLDGDGAISKREFRRAVQPLLNLPAGPEALDELFDLFDIDGSGCIGLKQIHDVLRRGQAMELPPELMQTREVAPRESRAQVRYELRKMERDGRKNGVVLRRRARPWEGLDMQVEYNDGVPVQVPVEEQISRALRQQGAHVVEMFKMWDEDGDGEVSRDEFRKAMPVLGVHASRQDVNACFDRWDPDGSGALSLRELAEALRAPPGAASGTVRPTTAPPLRTPAIHRPNPCPARYFAHLFSRQNAPPFPGPAGYRPGQLDTYPDLGSSAPTGSLFGGDPTATPRPPATPPF